MAMTNKILKKRISIPIYIYISIVPAERLTLNHQLYGLNKSVRKSRVPQFNFRKHCLYYTIVVTRFESAMMNGEEMSFTGLPLSSPVVTSY